MHRKNNSENQFEAVQLEFEGPYIECLNTLFNKAREINEYEYLCTLLRIRGEEDAGWDPLNETFLLMKDIIALLNTPLLGHTKIRLMLLLYSHLTEVDAVYIVLENMLRIIEYKPIHMNPFWHLYNKNKKWSSPPSAKKVVRYLIEHAKQVSISCLADSIESFFDEGIRNAFFHSDYILHENEFRTREGRFYQNQEFANISTGEKLQYKNVTQTVKFASLIETVQKGLNFFEAFKYVRDKHIRSYKKGKILNTNLSYQTMVLVHPENGAYGFAAGVGSLEHFSQPENVMGEGMGFSP